MFTNLLLALIAWLLWNIRQDMQESNLRQRGQNTNLTRLINRLEQNLKQNKDTPSAVKQAKAAPGADKASPVAATTKKSSDSELSVSLNQAGKGQLRKLPKVGAIVAERIIAARPFTSIEELREVEGINDALFEEIKGFVSVD
ncbi:MAG: helix-hairpin-helix domain-containing protein [Pseudomonadales bacterium]